MNYLSRSIPTKISKNIIENYQNNKNNNKFYTKFELPKIIKLAPKILKRKLDVLPYDRVNKIFKKFRYKEVNLLLVLI